MIRRKPVRHLDPTVRRCGEGATLDRRTLLRLAGTSVVGMIATACGADAEPPAPEDPSPAPRTVRDAFERADGPIGLADTGHPWTELAGTWSIASGRAVAASTYRSQVCTAVVDAGSADGRLEVSLTLSPTPLRANAGVVIRCVDAATNLFVKLERTPVNPDGLMSIGKKQEGEITYFRSKRRGIEFDNGDSVDLTVVVAGPDVRVRASTGEQLAHTLDPADLELFGTVTAHGLRINTAPDDDDGGSSFDRVSFVPLG